VLLVVADVDLQQVTSSLLRSALQLFDTRGWRWRLSTKDVAGMSRPAWRLRLRGRCGQRGRTIPRTGRAAAMAIADDLDRATDSLWDWVVEHTRTYES
jgi:hypothetical protein